MKHIEEPDRPKGEMDQPELDRSDLSFNLDNGPEPSNRDALGVLPEDMEYISDTNVAVLIKTPRGGRLLIYTMLLALLCAFVWASYARLDEITRGTGTMIPSSRLQVVQNLEGGILEKIFIKEGEQVVSGQPLMRLNDTHFSSTFRKSVIEHYSEQAKTARLGTELSGETLSFPEELDDYPDYVKREREIFRQRADRFNAELNVAGEQVTQARHELSNVRDQLKFLTTSFHPVKRNWHLPFPLPGRGLLPKWNCYS